MAVTRLKIMAYVSRTQFLKFLCTLQKVLTKKVHQSIIRRTSKKNNFLSFIFKSLTVRACKTNVTADQCPPNTSCKQKEMSDGLCTCLNGYEFNKNFSSNDTYCVIVSPVIVTLDASTSTTTTTMKNVVSSTSTVSTSTTLAPVKTSAKPTTTTTTKAPEKSTSSSSTTTSTTTQTSPFPVPGHEDGVQKEKVIEPEHMIGGVLLPLVIVATFIGGVFLIRKHNLLERAHSYLTERNWHLPGTARPNYTNDFDEFDDPLLI